ncbi:hypothetical protein CRUP_024632, partial [Coryphaenoides rupestris]
MSVLEHNKKLRAKMVVLSLKICVRQCNVVKTMQFEPSTAVYDACRLIRDLSERCDANTAHAAHQRDVSLKYSPDPLL